MEADAKRLTSITDSNWEGGGGGAVSQRVAEGATTAILRKESETLRDSEQLLAAASDSNKGSLTEDQHRLGRMCESNGAFMQDLE